MANFCSIRCAYKHARKLQEKAKVAKEVKANRVHRERKQAIKTNRQWASEAQQVFNKMRRLEELIWFKDRGIEPYCISCQKPLGNDQWACGHYKTRGARSDIAFDRLNTFLQHNVACNMHKSGDVKGYELGLAIRFGDDEAKRIIEYCEVRQVEPKRTAEDWQEMKRGFNAEIRRLQKLLDNWSEQ